MTILPSPAARRALANGKTVCVERGQDCRNGCYDYEINVYTRPGKYIWEGEWVAIREYSGGLNRLGDTRVENFDTEAEALAQAQAWV
jgi:hypothetical protein